MKLPIRASARTLTIAGVLWTTCHAGAFQAADNTKVNKDAAPTADQAKNNVSDREIMQKIRKSIVADKSLSTYGKNIKVISEHGKVTLKGPVHTAEESKNIEAKAVEIAGADNVVNQIEVKGDAK